VTNVLPGIPYSCCNKSEARHYIAAWHRDICRAWRWLQILLEDPPTRSSAGGAPSTWRRAQPRDPLAVPRADLRRHARPRTAGGHMHSLIDIAGGVALAALALAARPLARCGLRLAQTVVDSAGCVHVGPLRIFSMVCPCWQRPARAIWSPWHFCR
jgi:hypothetical protein